MTKFYRYLTYTPAGIEQEDVKSELLRSLLLLVFFLTVTIAASLNFLLFEVDIYKSLGGPKPIIVILSSIIFFIVYQSFIFYRLKRRLDLHLNLKKTFKLVHAFFEISFQSAITFYLVAILNIGSFSDSSIMSMYFLFIVVSVLHLDSQVCIFTALLAGAQYAALTYYEFHYLDVPEIEVSIRENSHYLKAIILFLSGGAAAFVSIDLQNRIRTTHAYRSERNELELLFGQQVSVQVSQTLIKGMSSTRRLDATVMFVDIRNFTLFADSHTAEEVVEYQNKFTGPLIDIINRHQGVVLQILGDGLMACFGSPAENVLHPDMAFQASVEIVRHVRFASSNGDIPNTNVGIGLHSGPLVAGNIGNEHRKQFSISGTPVIVAARIEQLNKKYGTDILISEEVFNRISPGRVDVNRVAVEYLRGIEKPVILYRVAA
jgi:adenylate cyclase